MSVRARVFPPGVAPLGASAPRGILEPNGEGRLCNRGGDLHRAVWILEGTRDALVDGIVALGVFGSVALVTGVIYLHGQIAKVFIGIGAIALLVSTIWNARLVRRCDAPVVLSRPAGA